MMKVKDILSGKTSLPFFACISEMSYLMSLLHVPYFFGYKTDYFPSKTIPKI